MSTATEPEPRPAVQLVATNVVDGCTAARCGDQRTVQLHPYLGRRCSEHVTLPPGTYRPDLSADMVDMGRPDAAFAYLSAWLSREARDRFDSAIDAVAVAW